MSEPLVVARLRAAGCVFAEDEARLLMDTARTPGELSAMVERRAAGLPLEQVLGWAEFCGLRIGLDPGVFVPRRRTEFLVEQAVARAEPGAIVVDLCCGAGAIGAALAAAVDRAEVHAADIDPAAVRCARRNVPGHVYQGDLYQPLPARLRGRVGIVTANVPYVPTAEIGFLPPEARAHEPLAALDGGADGLDVLRRVAAGAPGWLAPGGHLLIETSERQAQQAAAAFSASGLTAQVVTSAELNATVAIGRFEGRQPLPFGRRSQVLAAGHVPLSQLDHAGSTRRAGRGVCTVMPIPSLPRGNNSRDPVSVSSQLLSVRPPEMSVPIVNVGSEPPAVRRKGTCHVVGNHRARRRSSYRRVRRMAGHSRVGFGKSSGHAVAG